MSASFSIFSFSFSFLHLVLWFVLFFFFVGRDGELGAFFDIYCVMELSCDTQLQDILEIWGVCYRQ